MQCANCHTINLDVNTSCVNCGLPLIKLRSKVPANTLKKAPPLTEAPQVNLLACPYCHHRFRLTWPRYFKAPTGNYICPQCAQISSIERLWWPYILIIATGLITMSPSIFMMLLTDSYLYLLLGLIINLMLTIPLDKYINANYKNLVKRS